MAVNGDAMLIAVDCATSESTGERAEGIGARGVDAEEAGRLAHSPTKPMGLFISAKAKSCSRLAPKLNSLAYP